MSQGTLSLATVGVYSGLTAVNGINDALAALLTKNSGNSAPTNAPGGSPVLGQDWIDTTDANQRIWKVYTGGEWVTVGIIDQTGTGVFMPPLGGGSTTIASAGTTDIGSKHESHVEITGTTTITALGSTNGVVGKMKLVTFAGILTLTHHATSLILLTGANIVTAANDRALFMYLGSGNWRMIGYWRTNGKALAVDSISSLDSLSHLGIGTTADDTNYPLRALLNAARIDAKTAAGGGNGNALWEMHKEATGDDAGMRMLIGSTVYARIGVFGVNDLSLAVTPDNGSNWYNGILVANADGGVTLPLVTSEDWRWTDKGTVNSGTVTFNRATGGSIQRVQHGGNLTYAFSGWPASGRLGEMLLEIRGAGYSITWPAAVRFLLPDGTYQSTQPRALAGSSWTDWISIWTRDGGTTIWARM